MTEKLISVIVPVYNSEKYLKRCIDSIVAQTYKTLEIILINDGSSDNSGKICDQYALTDSRIKVFHQANAGQANARNIGLSIARGDYIGFVDSDDWISKEMYEKLICGIYNNNADIAVCGRKTVYSSTNNSVETFCFSQPQVFNHSQAIRQFLLTEAFDGSCWDKLFKKSILDNKEFPSGYLCEDVFFTFQSLLDSSVIVHIGDPLYYYFQIDGSSSHSKLEDKTYGLILYSNMIRDTVISQLPQMKEEADFFYLIRKFYYLKRLFLDKKRSFHKVDYSFFEYLHNPYIDKKTLFLLITMKLGLYPAVHKIFGKKEC